MTADSSRLDRAHDEFTEALKLLHVQRRVKKAENETTKVLQSDIQRLNETRK